MPSPRDGVVSSPVGAEMVLLDTESRSIHALNPVAALVWQCFDGEASLEEIIVDLAEGLSAPLEQIRDDVLTMTRSAGRAGLLDRVEPSKPSTPPSQTGLPMRTLVRVPVQIVPGNGRRCLMVNWSATCSFCERILPEFVAMQPALQRRDVDIVLVDSAEGIATRQQLTDSGMEAFVVSGQEGVALSNEAFSGTGTPVAYLLDDESRVASGLAHGALSVVELARSLAEEGSADSSDDSAAAIPRFLPLSGGVCGDGGSSTPSRNWQPTRALAAGEYTVGIRAASVVADRIITGAFAAHYRPDIAAPDNLSVVLGDTGRRGRRDMSVLLSGNSVVARSRSASRVVRALAAYLSCLLDPEEGLVRVDAVGALIEGEAVLLPKAILSSLEQVQAPLARLGFALVDAPFADLDVDKGALVVAAPRVSCDESVIRDLPAPDPVASEPGSVPPGRYDLRSWLLPVRHGAAGPLSPAAAVAGSLGAVVGDARVLNAVMDSFVSLTDRIEMVGVPAGNPPALLEVLRRWRDGET